MTFPQRLGYFGGGLVIGIILLFFFLAGKKTSCDYSPNARVLKNIRLKEKVFSAESLLQLQAAKLDTSIISKALANADVDFSKSNTQLDSCKIYSINGTAENKQLQLVIENCKNKAIITNIQASESAE